MGWLERLSDGLTKTRDKVRQSVGRLIGRGPAPEVLEDLEASLISADLGIRTVDRFMEHLRQSRGNGTPEGVLDILKSTILDTLRTSQAEPLERIIERGARPFVILAVGVTGIALTKLDGTARGGIVVAIADELKIHVRLIGVGEGAEDLQDFHAKEFVDALFEPA